MTKFAHADSADRRRATGEESLHAVLALLTTSNRRAS